MSLRLLIFNPNTRLLFSTSTNRLSFLTSIELSEIAARHQIYQLAIPVMARQVEIYVRRRTDREAHLWGHVVLPYKVILGRLLGVWSEISVVGGQSNGEEEFVVK